MINLFLRLFAAHLLADFFLQFDAINNGKYRAGLPGFAFLLLHGIIHALATYLLLAQWDNWFIPLFIFITHTLTDYAKVLYTTRCQPQSDRHAMASFLFDQLLHASFLLLSVGCYYWLWGQIPCSNALFADSTFNRYWLIAIAYMLIMKPSGILIALFTQRWHNALQQSASAPSSLAQAGAWIGYCERAIALSFILMNCLQGIGFLLAAKSIFRFGDLKDGRETQMTEYVLLGSLISMAIATIVGVATKELITNIC